MHEELHLIEQGGYVNQDLCTLPESITITTTPSFSSSIGGPVKNPE